MQEKNIKRKINIKHRLKINKVSLKVAVITLIYGCWLYFNQNVLSKYLLYELMQDYIKPSIIASIFIVIGTIMLISILIDKRVVKKLSTILVTAVWSTWAMSFFITPPPNSVWIFAAFVTALSYEALWVDNI